MAEAAAFRCACCSSASIWVRRMARYSSEGGVFRCRGAIFDDEIVRFSLSLITLSLALVCSQALSSRVWSPPVGEGWRRCCRRRRCCCCGCCSRWCCGCFCRSSLRPSSPADASRPESIALVSTSVAAEIWLCSAASKSDLFKQQPLARFATLPHPATFLPALSPLLPPSPPPLISPVQEVDVAADTRSVDDHAVLPVEPLHTSAAAVTTASRETPNRPASAKNPTGGFRCSSATQAPSERQTPRSPSPAAAATSTVLLKRAFDSRDLSNSCWN